VTCHHSIYQRSLSQWKTQILGFAVCPWWRRIADALLSEDIETNLVALPLKVTTESLPSCKPTTSCCRRSSHISLCFHGCVVDGRSGTNLPFAHVRWAAFTLRLCKFVLRHVHSDADRIYADTHFPLLLAYVQQDPYVIASLNVLDRRFMELVAFSEVTVHRYFTVDRDVWLPLWDYIDRYYRYVVRLHHRIFPSGFFEPFDCILSWTDGSSLNMMFPDAYYYWTLRYNLRYLWRTLLFPPYTDVFDVPQSHLLYHLPIEWHDDFTCCSLRDLVKVRGVPVCIR
jgi:hypothetical protein